ncbi:MAG: GerMN domain-containing protein [Lachnospiraceae bacterium]|nr:GerMN domain-containing protein [Lachnospiraceae bacterium]
MKKLMILLLSAVTVLLCACRNDNHANTDTFPVYALNPDETKLVSRESDILLTDPQCVEKLMKALCESDTREYVSAVSKGDSAPVWSFSETDGVLHITENSLWNLDSPPIVRTLRKAAVVKTFSAVKEVKEIRFGSDYPSYSMEKLTTDSITESLPLDAVRQKITVYYSNEIRTGLVPQYYYIIYNGDNSPAYMVMNRLISGPGKDEVGYVRTLTPDTKINSITIKNAVCKVDFTEAFLTPPTDVQPWIILKSIVNTLCEIDGIQYVTFSVEGNENVSYFGFPLNELYNTDSLNF